MVDPGLLFAEGIAFVRAAHGRFNAAHAAPAMALPGGEKAHLLNRMVDTTAIAVFHFRHRNLLGECFSEREFENAASLLRQHDAARIRVMALKSRLPKLDVQFFQGMS
jgi:uncharacterized protein (DUF1330 family)